MRRGAALVLLLALFAFGAARASFAIASTPVSAARPASGIEIVDDLGRVLRLAESPRRIVSLAPHATELLFAAGLGSSVVAVDRDSDHPPQVRELPRVANLPPSIEQLLALRPDLVVAWAPGMRPGFVERLASFGVPAYVSEPRTLDDVAATLGRFETLASGDDARVGSVGAAAQFSRQLAALRSKWAGRQPVRVFVQIWGSPLITISDRDVIGDALRSCGGVNISGGMPTAAPQLDIETVLAARPRLIVATDSEASRVRWRQVGMLEPVGDARFEYLDAATLQRPGPRVLDAVDRLCEAIDAARR